MILRILLLGVVLMLAYGGVSVVSRRPGRGTKLVPPGITMIEADGCHQCEAAKRRFAEAGVSYQSVDAGAASTLGLKTLTVPTVYVGTAEGRVVMTRRGASVLSDLDIIVTQARFILANSP